MAFCFASPDAIRAALNHLDKEWGSDGYYIEELDTPLDRENAAGARIHVVHGDGSRFTIEADRYGNITPETKAAKARRAGSLSW